jgi:hypothetical protein
MLTINIASNSAHWIESNKKGKNNVLTFFVPGVGLEPTHLAAADFESAASTDFATRACPGLQYYIIPFNFLHNYFFSPQILVNSEW